MISRQQFIDNKVDRDIVRIYKRFFGSCPECPADDICLLHLEEMNSIYDLLYEYFERGYDEGYDDGSDSGYDEGYEEGHSIGYSEGHEEGYEEGYDVGHFEA